MGTKIELSFAEQFRVLLDREGKSVSDIAQSLSTTRQNLNQKLGRGNLSEKDMETLASALGYNVEITLKKK